MRTAYFQLALSMCLVGINIAVGKVIAQEISIFLFAILRFMIATAVLLPLVLLQKREPLHLTPKEWGLLFLQAFFGVFLFSIFMLYGVRYTTAISAGIITSTTPALIAVTALILLREKLDRYGCASVVLAVSGILLISTDIGGLAAGTSGTLTGNALILFAVISEALFTVLAKSVSMRIDSLRMTAIINAFGVLLFIPYSVHTLSLEMPLLSPLLWLLIIYYSLTASVFSFLLWFNGISRIPANKAGLFTVFMPISSALIGILFLKETMSIGQIIGMVLAIAAISIGIKSKKIPA